MADHTSLSVAGTAATINYGSNRFIALSTSVASNYSTEAQAQVKIYRSLTALNYQVKSGSNTVNSASSITFRKGASDTDLAISIPASTSGLFEDLSHSVALVANDLVDHSVTTGGTSGSLDVRGIIVNLKHATNTLMMCAISRTTVMTPGSAYTNVNGFGALIGTETIPEWPIRYSATWEKLRIYIAANNLTGTSTIKSRVDAADGNMAVSIGAGETGAFEDAANTDSLSAGQKIDLSWSIGAGTNLSPTITQTELYASTDNTYPLLSMSGGAAVAYNSINYVWPSGQLSTGSTTPANNSVVIRNWQTTLSGWSVYCYANTLDGATTIGNWEDGVGYGAFQSSIAAATTGLFEDTTSTQTMDLTASLCNRIDTKASASGTVSLSFICLHATAATPFIRTWVGGQGSQPINYATTVYSGCCGSGANNATEDYYQLLIRSATIGKFATCWISSNTLDGATTVTLRKNKGDLTQTFSIAASTTGSFSDMTHTDSLVSGDLICAKVATGGTTGTITFRSTGVCYEYSATNAVAYIAADLTASASPSAGTEYCTIGGTISRQSTESDTQYVIRFGATFSNMRVYVATNTLTKDAVYRFRKNTANGNQVVTVTSATTGAFEDATNTDIVVSGDTINVSITYASGVSGSYTPKLLSFKEAQNQATAGEALIAFSGGSTVNANQTTYFYISGTTTSGAGNQNSSILPHLRATVKNLFVRVTANTQNSGTATFADYMMHNLSTNFVIVGTVSVSISAGSTGAFEDLTDSDELRASDGLTLRGIIGGTSGSLTLMINSFDLQAFTLWATNTAAMGVDVVLKKVGLTGAMGADVALKKLALTTPLGVDVALKKLSLNQAFGADLALRIKDLSTALGVDAAIRKLNLNTTYGITVALKILQLTQTYGVDIVLGKLGQTTQFGVDAALGKKGLTKVYGVDVVLGKKGLTKALGVDLALKKTSLTSAYGEDVALRKLGITKQMGVDVALRKTLTKALGVDLLLVLRRSMAYGIDIYLTRGHIALFSIDLALKKFGLTLGLGIDILLSYPVGTGFYGEGEAIPFGGEAEAIPWGGSAQAIKGRSE